MTIGTVLVLYCTYIMLFADAVLFPLNNVAAAYGRGYLLYENVDWRSVSDSSNEIEIKWPSNWIPDGARDIDFSSVGAFLRT